MADLIPLAQRYFDEWNARGDLRSLLADDAMLRDWDIEEHGGEAVAEANNRIFKALPNIKIDITAMHPSTASSTVACEILVNLNDGTDTVLKVCDVIEFDVGGKIKAVRAYKC